jgi:hypothetical protein
MLGFQVHAVSVQRGTGRNVATNPTQFTCQRLRRKRGVKKQTAMGGASSDL